MSLSQLYRDDPRVAHGRCVDAYAELSAAREKKLPFVSDWNGLHPWAYEYFAEILEAPTNTLGDFRRYNHPQSDIELIAEIRKFHFGVNDIFTRNGVSVLIGAGSTGLLSTALMCFADSKLKAIVAPGAHYTVMNVMLRIGLEPQWAAEDLLFTEDTHLSLPAERSLLVMSDPLWFCGRRVRPELYAEIGQWQRDTGSLVLIDSTFDYLDWDAAESEHVTPPSLSSDHTIRIACPTKSFALNGIRFAYMLAPERLFASLFDIQDSFHGTSGVVDRAFGIAMMRQLNRAESNRKLVKNAADAYEDLVRRYPALSQHIVPTSGYFLFARLPGWQGKVAAMDGRHFLISGYDDYIRLNLFSPEVDQVLAQATR